jgi:flagellar hook-associated protein 2
MIDEVETGAGNSSAYTGAAAASGAYTGNQNQTFLVEIMSGGAVGTAAFRYSTDGGLTFNDNGGAGFLTSTAGTALEDGVSISFSDSGALTEGDTFSIDTFVPTIQAAQDASITLGSASGGGAPITITSSTNTITNAIPGVTLNLVGADPATSVRITVDEDTEAVKTTITSFVDSYNQVIDFLNQQLRYDSVTEQGGLLIGDSLLVSVQNDLRRMATDVIGGLPPEMNRLSAIGITSVSETGKLVIDDAKLQQALSDNLSGVTDLFSTSFASTNSGVTYVSSTGKTMISSSGFLVDITQAATQGTLEGETISSFPVTLTASNNQISLNVDGKESSVLTLTAKTYASGDELAEEIQTKLDADPALAGKGVSVGFNSGHLVFTSSIYGSPSTVQLGAEPPNSAFADLGFSHAVSTAGKDVQGTINGESATGRGQILK